LDIEIQKKFEGLWAKYFGDADLPIVLFYTDQAPDPSRDRLAVVPRCVIAGLHQVRRGSTLFLDTNVNFCRGGRRFLGLGGELRRNFDHFLACGIPGKLEGERYKKTPELAREITALRPPFTSPARYAAFRRWDKLAEADHPEVVIFLAEADVLAGLFTLANFDEGLDGVIAPFGAGCSAIAHYPYLENQSDHPRAVLGMFDISARQYVSPGELSFAVPMKKFSKMIDNMEESFLITDAWAKLQNRISWMDRVGPGS
jgi:uncharacterized protein (DUF169 family)